MTPWELHILDVGQGSSVVVVLPAEHAGAREALVIDSADAITTLDCLERCGVVSLPLVLITHSDDDHARGVPRVVQQYLEGVITWYGNRSVDSVGTGAIHFG